MLKTVGSSIYVFGYRTPLNVKMNYPKFKTGQIHYINSAEKGLNGAITLQFYIF
jgi:hypothetical protein